MKEIRELKFEELTTKQKLGIVHTPLIHEAIEPDKIDYIIERIKERAIGIVWVQWKNSQKYRPFFDGVISRIREAADYPIVIITDAESGIGDYLVGQHSAIGATDSEKHAYAFGKATAIGLRERGYDMVCHPVLDARDSGWTRGYSDDKYKITRLAKAETQGLHDGGILTMAKHYPSAKYDVEVDTHMTEASCSETEKELLSAGLYPYLELIREGLLDGIMAGHEKLKNIDPDAPASMSKKCIDIIRRQGFDGLMMTDALDMMGIRETYGRVGCVGVALEAGEDAPLYYDLEPEITQNAFYECYEKGIISDAELDRAVKNILALQHKAYLYRKPKCTELTEEEISLVKSINRDSIFAVLDEGTPLSLNPNGKYYFALMVKNEYAQSTQNGLVVDTFSGGWRSPAKIINKINELFPNSLVDTFFEFPTPQNGHKILSRSLDYDEVIFITFSEFSAYVGPERLSHRVVALIDAMQNKGRIGTLIHNGNPKVTEELAHIPRRIYGGRSAEASLAVFDVLSGKIGANGKPNYKLNLK